MKRFHSDRRDLNDGACTCGASGDQVHLSGCPHFVPPFGVAETEVIPNPAAEGLPEAVFCFHPGVLGQPGVLKNHPASGLGAEGAQRQAGDRDAGTPHLSEASIYSNPDARAWAKFFVRSIRDLPDRGIQPAKGEPFFSSELARIVLDEDYMLGWFACAMNVKMEANVTVLERRLAVVKVMLETQGNTGNWDFDEYMRGLFNGLELAVSSMENRETQFRDGVKKHPQDTADDDRAAGYADGVAAGMGTMMTSATAAMRSQAICRPPKQGFFASLNRVMSLVGWAVVIYSVIGLLRLIGGEL